MEVKAHVKNINELEQVILQDNGQYLKTVHQRDIYFKHPARNFAKTDEALRIRCEEDDRARVTYKGPKLDRKSKSREEFEVEINNPEILEQIFVNLGFVPVPGVEKIRKLYKLGDMTISLDEVKDVGEFIEVEIETASKNDYKAKRNLIFAQLKKWGIQKSQRERLSYLELYFIVKNMKRE